GGLTLIEVTFALVILSIGLAPMMTALTDGATQTIDTTQSSVASFLITEQIEQIVAARYRAIGGYTLVTSANFPNETPASGFPALNRTTTIQEVSARGLWTTQAGAGIKRVTVVVSWRPAPGPVSLTGLFARDLGIAARP